MKACAELSAKGRLTLDDLAAKLGVDRADVRRWKYGLGRSLKKLAADLPGAPHLLEQE